MAIARRELSAYLASPIGWIVICNFVLLWGIFFAVMLVAYNNAAEQAVFNPYGADQLNVNDAIITPLFGNLSVIALLASPALTMRLIAEDRRNRSIELLLTSPVRSGEIVLGKFFGAIAFSGVLGAAMLVYAGILYALGEPDPGVLIANYTCFFLLFGTYMAAGLLASSLTENQIVALVLAFGFNLTIWIFGWFGSLLDDGSVKTVVEYVSMLNHIEQMSKGVVHIEDAVYFLSFIGFCLFAATQRVEALRWR